MDLVFIRFVFVAVTAIACYELQPLGLRPMVAAGCSLASCESPAQSIAENPQTTARASAAKNRLVSDLRVWLIKR